MHWALPSSQSLKEEAYSSDPARDSVWYERCLCSRYDSLDRAGPYVETQHRHDNDAATEFAYNWAVQRNFRLLEAYRLLSEEYQQLAQEVPTLAGQNYSLQREIADLQTSVLAYEAMVCRDERGLAEQESISSKRGEEYAQTEALLVEIRKLQKENAEMQRALTTASELLATSRNKSFTL